MVKPINETETRADACRMKQILQIIEINNGKKHEESKEPRSKKMYEDEEKKGSPPRGIDRKLGITLHGIIEKNSKKIKAGSLHRRRR